jgi:hypothetical protein
MGGVAIARTIAQARQRLADMLIFCDPDAPATRADIVALPRAEPVADYDGTAGDIVTRVNAGTPAAQSSPTPSPPRRMGSGERDVPDPGHRDHDHRPPPQPAAGRGYNPWTPGNRSTSSRSSTTAASPP